MSRFVERLLAHGAEHGAHHLEERLVIRQVRANAAEKLLVVPGILGAGTYAVRIGVLQCKPACLLVEKLVYESRPTRLRCQPRFVEAAARTIEDLMDDVDPIIEQASI